MARRSFYGPCFEEMTWLSGHDEFMSDLGKLLEGDLSVGDFEKMSCGFLEDEGKDSFYIVKFVVLENVGTQKFL